VEIDGKTIIVLIKWGYIEGGMSKLRKINERSPPNSLF